MSQVVFSSNFFIGTGIEKKEHSDERGGGEANVSQYAGLNRVVIADSGKCV